MRLSDALRLGVAHQKAGRLSQARAIFQKLIEDQPKSGEALYLLGTVALKEGKAEEAENLIRSAIELDGENPIFHANLSIALQEEGQFDEAVSACRRALELRPDYPVAYNLLGAAYLGQGRQEDAVECFQHAIEQMPELHGAYHNLAKALAELGRIDEAIAVLRRLIELKPDFTDAYRSLGRIKKFSQSDSEVNAMRALAHNRSLDHNAQTNLHFALGKACNDLGEYDQAFQHFITANQMRRRKIVFNLTLEQSRLRRLTSAFDAQFFNSLKDLGCGSEVPIFIVGMPRSGTSLVEQILASHPKIFGAGERDDIGRARDRLIDSVDPSRTKQFADCVPLIARDAWQEFGKAYVETLRSLAPTATRVTDKNPLNFRWLGLIRVLLPNAKIIHCTRNPIDTCVSCYTHLFLKGCDWSHDLTELGQFYGVYREMMDHWKQVLPGPFLESQYEILIEDFEESARRLIEFCGLEWDDACLDFHKSERVVATPSVGQVRQPIYKTSVERWRRYERHLDTLIEALEAHAPRR